MGILPSYAKYSEPALGRVAGETRQEKNSAAERVQGERDCSSGRRKRRDEAGAERPPCEDGAVRAEGGERKGGSRL